MIKIIYTRTPEICEAVQLKAFTLGYSWGPRKPADTTPQFVNIALIITLEENMLMYFDSCDNFLDLDSYDKFLLNIDDIRAGWDVDEDAEYLNGETWIQLDLLPEDV